MLRAKSGAPVTVGCVDFYVLVGNDDQAISDERRRLLGSAGSFEVVDVAQDRGGALVAAVRTPSFFGRRVVAAEHLEAVSADALEALASAAAGSDALVVARAGVLSPKKRAALAKVADIRRVDLPTGAGAAKAVDAIARAAGVRLSAEARSLCVAHTLEAVRGAVAALADAGNTRPSVSEVGDALGELRAEAAPWELTDAVDADDPIRILDVCANVVPVVAAAYLGSYLARIGRLQEARAGSSAEAADMLGIPKFSAEKCLRQAARRSHLAVVRAVDRCADLELEVRGGGVQALEAGAVAIWRLLNEPAS